MPPRKRKSLSVAVLGLSHWGSHFIRIFRSLGITTYGVDPSPAKRKALSRIYPEVVYDEWPDRVFDTPGIGAVVIATPSSTHFLLTKQSLLNRKHVLVEKPMTQSVAEAKTLAALAGKTGRILMVDHTFVYSPALSRLRDMIRSRALGTVTTIESVRIGPGIVRPDSSVLWDLAPHDISICWFLLGRYPQASRVLSSKPAGHRISREAEIELSFSGGTVGRAKLSWINPVRERSLTVNGTRGRATIRWEGAEESFLYRHVSGRSEDVEKEKRMPFPRREPLELAVLHFLSCIKDGTPPITDAGHGARVTGIIADMESASP